MREVMAEAPSAGTTRSATADAAAKARKRIVFSYGIRVIAGSTIARERSARVPNRAAGRHWNAGML
jgi:hypothetical protein